MILHGGTSRRRRWYCSSVASPSHRLPSTASRDMIYLSLFGWISITCRSVPTWVVRSMSMRHSIVGSPRFLATAATCTGIVVVVAGGTISIVVVIVRSLSVRHSMGRRRRRRRHSTTTTTCRRRCCGSAPFRMMPCGIAVVAGVVGSRRGPPVGTAMSGQRDRAGTSRRIVSIPLTLLSMVIVMLMINHSSPSVSFWV